MSTLALLADEQARLDARPWKAPPATLAEVTTLAARVEAEAQVILWDAWAARCRGDVEAWYQGMRLYRERTVQARRLYWHKRILIGWRRPGPYLRGHRARPTPPKVRGGGTNAGAQALAAQRLARLDVAREAMARGASTAEAAALAGYRSAHVLRTVLATERAKARRAAA